MRACDAGAALALVPPPLLLLLLLRTFIQQRAAAAEAAACVVAVGYVDGSQSSDLRNGRGNFDALREIS